MQGIKTIAYRQKIDYGLFLFIVYFFQRSCCYKGLTFDASHL